jgi:hypothetical protein
MPKIHELPDTVPNGWGGGGDTPHPFPHGGGGGGGRPPPPSWRATWVVPAAQSNDRAAKAMICGGTLGFRYHRPSRLVTSDVGGLS